MPWIRVVLPDSGPLLVEVTWEWWGRRSLAIKNTKVKGPIAKSVRARLALNARSLATYGGTVPTNGLRHLVVIEQELRLTAREQEAEYSQSEDWYAQRDYPEELVAS